MATKLNIALYFGVGLHRDSLLANLFELSIKYLQVNEK